MLLNFVFNFKFVTNLRSDTKTVLVLSFIFFSQIIANLCHATSIKHEGHGGPIMGLTTSPDRDLLVSTSFDYSVLVWQLDDIKEIKQLIGHDAAVNVAKFSNSGKLLATAGDDAKIFLWDFHKPVIPRTSRFILDEHTAKVVDLDFSRDDQYLASASWDHSIKIWDAETGKLVKSIFGHDGPVNSVKFSEDSQYLYSAGYDGTIRQWKLSDGDEVRTLVDNGWGVNVLMVDEVENLLLYGTIDGLMTIRSLDGQEVFIKILEEGAPVSALKYYPDYKKAVFGNMNGRIIFIDLAKMKIQKDFLAVDGPVWDVVYNSENETLIVGGLDDTLIEWQLKSFHSNYFLPKPNDRRFQQTDALSNGALQFARKCSICHTLDSSEIGRRAGPPLLGVFGRKAGTISDYPYSDALLKSDIIWNEETISKLFEKGPEIVTPGTKMPIQKIKRNEDRLDLINFLKDATRTN
ncbi:MAG: cytochrome C [Paracoccaceae bacterium]|nr:cytochrome C [Paracoccaceae bacterium]